jgi:hypothetical protein
LEQQQSNKKGIIIFGTVVLIFLVLSLFAYVITGDKGIEERFSNAVGLPSETEREGDNGILSFTLEGNHIYYVIILVLILIATVLIYLKYKV